MKQYKEKIIEEYRFVKEKYKTLNKILTMHINNQLAIQCPIEAIREEAEHLRKYIHVLESMALVEGINIKSHII